MALRDEFKADYARLRTIREIHANPGSEHLARVLPEPENAAQLDRFKRVVTAGVVLARQQDADVLALTVEATAADERVLRLRQRARQVVVATPTLAHGPTRDRLRLASDPGNRKLLGYGRQVRGTQRGADGDAAEPALGSGGKDGDSARQDRRKAHRAASLRQLPRARGARGR